VTKRRPGRLHRLWRPLSPARCASSCASGNWT